MSNKSNSNGRAFEYILCHELKEAQKLYGYTVQSTRQTELNQERDAEKFNSLDEPIKAYYVKHSKRITAWLLEDELAVDEQDIVSINRMPDKAGNEGNPTDIELMVDDNRKINLSLKHNNFSQKHQRPGGLFSQLGVDEPSDEKLYRQELKNISNAFFEKAHDLVNGAKLFAEIKKVDPKFVDNNLYNPVVDLYTATILKHSKKEEICRNFFNFIIGDINYVQVITNKNNIYVKKFNNIRGASSLKIDKTNASNFLLTFDNGFSFNFRLHTASSRVEGCRKSCCSLKFDTTFVRALNIPMVELS